MATFDWFSNEYRGFRGGATIFADRVHFSPPSAFEIRVELGWILIERRTVKYDGEVFSDFEGETCVTKYCRF